MGLPSAWAGGGHIISGQAGVVLTHAWVSRIGDARPAHPPASRRRNRIAQAFRVRSYHLLSAHLAVTVAVDDVVQRDGNFPVAHQVRAPY